MGWSPETLSTKGTLYGPIVNERVPRREEEEQQKTKKEALMLSAESRFPESVSRASAVSRNG